jgi:tripartite-type tricarboxylate transporter receptor subunit TctC
VINHVLGTRFKIIEGYKGPADVIIAIERGEVQGVCSAYAQFRTHEQLIRDGKLRIILRAEETPVPELAHVPSVYGFAKTEEQRRFLRFVLSTTEFGRPYVMPPETPKAIVAIMRKAMADAVRDPKLIAEAQKMKLDMTYTPPEQIEQLLARLYETPPAMIEAVRKLIPHL